MMVGWSWRGREEGREVARDKERERDGKRERGEGKEGAVNKCMVQMKEYEKRERESGGTFTLGSYAFIRVFQARRG